MATISLLSIGNSFSQDAQRYLYDIARSAGDTIECVNLYIGGCSLERHYRNMKADAKAYDLQICGHVNTGFFSGIKEALLSRAWDYVTIQQASHFSYNFETYEPYLTALASYVRELCPKAKLLIHETWAYESGSPRIHEHGFETYEEMFEKVKDSYEKANKIIRADGIIPCGEALLEMQKGGKTVHRDTFHASYGLGRYLLGLTFYAYLTGKYVKDIPFNDFDEAISPEDILKAKEIVDRIVNKKDWRK